MFQSSYQKINKRLRKLQIESKVPRFGISVRIAFWNIVRELTQLTILLTTKPSDSYQFFTKGMRGRNAKYSFVAHNQYQRKLKISILGVLVTPVFVVLMSYIVVTSLVPEIDKVLAATFDLVQTGWDASASSGTYATHPDDASSWTAYEAKDANIDTTTVAVPLSLPLVVATFRDTAFTGVTAKQPNGRPGNVS